MPSSQNLGRVWAGEAESRVLVQASTCGPGQGRPGSQGESFLLPETRSLQLAPKRIPSLPSSSQGWTGNDPREATEQFQDEVMAIWHQGRAGGRHTEKRGASAPFPYSYSPFPEGYVRNQCRARPSLRSLGWTPSLLGGEAGRGGGMEATPSSRRTRMKQRQHNDGGREGPGR